MPIPVFDLGHSQASRCSWCSTLHSDTAELIAGETHLSCGVGLISRIDLSTTFALPDQLQHICKTEEFSCWHACMCLCNDGCLIHNRLHVHLEFSLCKTCVLCLQKAGAFMQAVAAAIQCYWGYCAALRHPLCKHCGEVQRFSTSCKVCSYAP